MLLRGLPGSPGGGEASPRSTVFSGPGALTLLNLRRKPVVVTICLLVAALHLVTGPDYRGPWRPFVTGYLMDLALPFAMVLLLGVGLEHSPTLQRPGLRVMAVFAVGAAVEFLQYRGVPIFGRTFDVLDLLMYAMGSVGAVGFERVVFAPMAPGRR